MGVINKVKLLDFKVLKVVPFNDFDPPKDLKHMSRFITAWLVEIDNALYAFFVTKEECWLGNYVKETGEEFSFIKNPDISNEGNRWFDPEERLVLYEYLPANEWMGITEQTNSYTAWMDDDASDEEKAADKLLYCQFNDIFERFVPGWDDRFPHDFYETEFDLELEDSYTKL